MNIIEEKTKKWQLKKIATLAFISDECDDMKSKDRRAFYSMMEAIFDEVISELKNLNEEVRKDSSKKNCKHKWVDISRADIVAEKCSKCGIIEC